MDLKQICETFDYRITEGSEYCWSCYGPNARYLDFDNDHGYGSAVFDTVDQTVYMVEVIDKTQTHTYRWMNPEYTEAFYKECSDKHTDPHLAWNDKNWTELEVEDDFLTKASAIFAGVEFDTRVSVPIDLDDDSFLKLARMAHERDITLNKMIELALQELIDSLKRQAT